MKIAHMTKVTPGHICGLYETTRDLITGLRQLGYDSRLVEADLEHNEVFPHGLKEDRGIPIEMEEWAINESDLIVSHSGYGAAVAAAGKPTIYCQHGRPRVSYLTEKNGGLGLYSYFYNRNRAKDRWSAVVTFWPEHVPYLEVMFTEIPVHAIPAPVNLDFWTPDGPKSDFSGREGDINVVCADAWREDNDPFDVLNAFLIHARQRREQRGQIAKLHIYGKPKNLPGAGAIVRQIQDEGHLGEVIPMLTQEELAMRYRRADFALSCNQIATRTVREAMACGCPVWRVPETLFIPMFFEDADRVAVRRSAEKQSSPLLSAQAFAQVIEETVLKRAA